MSRDAEALIAEAQAWWTTKIIDVHPGKISMRGYPIQELIGQVTFPQMIWLMVRGDLPNAGQARLLEAALVASVDHGPHAPSIAIARMAVTCGLPLNGAMASSVNVLDDVHGGAGQQCMELYADIAARIDAGVAAEAATDAALDDYVAKRGKIVAGFGHRFHPIDPRTEPLLRLVREAAEQGVVDGRYVAIGQGVEAALRRRTGKNIPMNIDGSTAVIFSELGFKAELGRGLFILSRSVGILSHAWEQTETGVRMKGPMPKSIPYTYAGPPLREVPATAVDAARDAGRRASSSEDE